MITVRFFARLRELLECEELVLEMGTPTTVSELRRQLVRTRPHWDRWLDPGQLLCAVNHDMARADSAVQDGDEVAFFPPVTGG